MARKRTSLAELASLPTMDAPVPDLGAAPPRLLRVPPSAVAVNPINPRRGDTNLADLESMRTAGQLQPCLVVTRAAFVAIHPEHEDAVIGTTYVVVAGTRRRLAAEQFQLPTLDVVVRDAVAVDRITFYSVSILENVDREQLSALDEAQAVEHLAAEAGSKAKAAELLGKSAGWVSQRLALLDLTPALQDALRAGELPIREARRLGRLPAEAQEEAWRAERPPPSPPPEPEPEEELYRGTASANEPPAAPQRSAKPQEVRLRVEAPLEVMATKMENAMPREQLVALATLIIARAAEDA